MSNFWGFYTLIQNTIWGLLMYYFKRFYPSLPNDSEIRAWLVEGELFLLSMLANCLLQYRVKFLNEFVVTWIIVLIAQRLYVQHYDKKIYKLYKRKKIPPKEELKEPY